MKKPSAFQLFCMYHLGLSPRWEPKFYNINSAARELGVLPEQVMFWLREYGLASEQRFHVDYNLARAYGEVQDLAMKGRLDLVKSYAKKVFSEYMQALQGYKDSHKRFDVDYDNIWGDEESELE